MKMKTPPSLQMTVLLRSPTDDTFSDLPVTPRRPHTSVPTLALGLESLISAVQSQEPLQAVPPTPLMDGSKQRNWKDEQSKRKRPEPLNIPSLISRITSHHLTRAITILPPHIQHSNATKLEDVMLEAGVEGQFGRPASVPLPRTPRASESTPLRTAMPVTSKRLGRPDVGMGVTL